MDANLRRVVRHEEPVRGDRPELSDAQRILADEAARREALFQQSVAAEKGRGDALSRTAVIIPLPLEEGPKEGS